MNMSDIKVSISCIANKSEQQAYKRSSMGGINLPVGTMLASVCYNGSDCGVEPFWDMEDLTKWLTEQIEPKMKAELKRKPK